MKRATSFSESDVESLQFPSSQKRPVSYSESDVNMLRLSEILINPVEKIVIKKPKTPWYWKPHRLALRFTLHLTLVSLFETVFFWKFVSVQEDDALLTLVDSYTEGIWSACGNLSTTQKQSFLIFVDFFLNSTTIQSDSANAYHNRSEFNTTLVVYSWIYFTFLVFLFSVLAGAAVYKKVPIRWTFIIGENIVLVIFLGLYELMFFRTVALKYQAISIPELDSNIYNQIQEIC